MAGATTAAGVLGAGVTPALADTDTASTVVNVVVTSSITLTELTPSFTLTGAPGEVVTTGANPVRMRVTTNNFAGYTVTVAPRTAALTPSIAGNTDTIPTNLLQVNGPAQGSAYVPLSFGTPVVVATKSSASGADGDVIVNNYRITIPFVRPDTYSGILDYVATTL
ncbi:hypothetical protein [Sphaerisporangium album]|uniref:hypothetical protein n=1 Tax=Sphaerisporangium album TaxID=509200 RepID=UPI001C68F588|nr:hypothetical protein [Sphaerisporangium album]